MAGLTKEMIFQAADAVFSRTGKVTNESVLEELGSGSMTTVTKYMREWRQLRRESSQQSHESTADPQAEPIHDFSLDDNPAVAKTISDIQSIIVSTVSAVVSEQRASAATVQKAMQDAFNDKIEQAQLLAEQQAQILRTRIEQTIEEYEENLAAGSARMDQLTETIKERDSTLQCKVNENSELEARIAAVIDERNEANISVATLTEKLNGASDTCQRLVNQNSELAQNIDNLTGIIRKLELAEHTAVAQRDSAQFEVKRLRPFETEAATQRQKADNAMAIIEKLNAEQNALQDNLRKVALQVYPYPGKAGDKNYLGPCGLPE